MNNTMNGQGSRSEALARLVEPGVIAVIRAAQPEPVLPACEALVAGGVVALEITMTTPRALCLIDRARRRFGADAIVGAGSVTSGATAREAIQAGAQFIVSPICKPEIATASHAADCPVMLGAFTPTEAQLAHEAGADFIKIFPAENLGPAYIKSLRAPLPHLRIVPTGGVDLHNVKDFIKAGCAALGVGSSLISPVLLREANWAELARLADAFVQAVRTARA
jgi:2-dehydro-3-deoxyphosphogluconate aldolase / (4S)-4-hydroxy-2-oxoglutarate aldolase